MVEHGGPITSDELAEKSGGEELLISASLHASVVEDTEGWSD